MSLREIVFSKWFYLLVFPEKRTWLGNYYSGCALSVSTTPLRGFEENVLVTHHIHLTVRSTDAKRAKRKLFILGQQMKLVDKRVT